MLIDTFVRPTSVATLVIRLHFHNVTFRCRQPVTDYRSSETGLKPHHLQNAPKIEDVRKSLRRLLQARVVVGYRLWELFLVRPPPAFSLGRISDLILLSLKFLGLSHPAIDTRDLASFVPFRKSLGYKSSQIVPLKILVNKFMGRDLGSGYEHPVSTWSPVVSEAVVATSGR